MKKRPPPFTFSKGGGRFFQVQEILNLMTLPAHLRPKSRPHCGRLASETRLRAQCGAVWLAGARISAPRLLSCFLFVPSVRFAVCQDCQVEDPAVS